MFTQVYQGVMQLFILFLVYFIALSQLHYLFICIFLGYLMTFFYFIGYVMLNGRMIVNCELEKM
jgi:hypothetical protein